MERSDHVGTALQRPRVPADHGRILNALRRRLPQPNLPKWPTTHAFVAVRRRLCCNLPSSGTIGEYNTCRQQGQPS
jgi:hypothetical protein